ncbi:MAG: hypothetical protein V1873_06660 [Verrucomicrobiota bacterium]
MAEKKQPGLKSALDLALERLESKGGKLQALTDEQKKALAEIDRRAQAKIAEIEILMEKHLAAARAKGDPEEIQKAEQEKMDAIAKVRRHAEDDREHVRKNG